MSKLWAGGRSDSEMLWVYDPEVPHVDPDMVYLYNAGTGSMKGWEKEFARGMLRQVTGSRADESFEKYRKWRATPEAENFLKRDSEKHLQKRRKEIGEAKRRHSEYLKKHGKDNKGTRVSIKRPRITHCYACKQPLNSGLFLECNSCAWLICYCGACGCGYSAEPI